MLPRSLFSASSLKLGESSSHQYRQNSDNNSESSPDPSHELPPRFLQESSAESSSQVDSSDEDNLTSAEQPTNLQDLMHQLARLQAKQKVYIEKTQKISQQMEETSARIAQLTGMSLVPRSKSDGSSSRAGADRKRITKTQSKAPAKTVLSKRNASTHDVSPVKVARTDGVRATAKRTGGPPSRSATTAGNVEQVEARINQRQQRDQDASKNVKLASQDVCDLYLYRNQDVKNTAVQKKPRSLLYNIAPDHADLKDLMVSTSLKGDMQFWNAKSRTIIKTVGPEAFYDSAWIEELCWMTPTTLAMCKGHPKQGENADGERVSLAHIDSVSGNDVKLRVQHLADCPHEKGILAISPIDIGHTGSTGVEHASIVTGGTDKMVCLWDLVRDSPYENFELSNVSKLNINHTNTVHTLCFDPVNQRLLTGGADAKIFTYDMLSQKTATEMKIGHRINHILQSSKEPNMFMASLAQTNDQFAMYDQRTPGIRGLVLNFGYAENENISRYIRPDWHQNGYMVVCGSQSEAKVHFWDIRYSGVQRGPCFSFLTQGSQASRILRTLFIPNQDSLVTMSATRTMTWTDYSVQHNSRIHSFDSA